MRTLSILLFFFTSIVVVTSCQKEVDFDPTNPANTGLNAVTGDFKAKINGTQWVANKAAGAARIGGIINLTGYSTDRKIVTISLTDSGVHKYVLSNVTMNVAAMIDSNDRNRFAFATNEGNYPTTSGGEVNITAIDTAKKTITGTFSFKMFRADDQKQKTFTEGSFTDLVYITTLPAPSATDTFNVNIDGAAWTPVSITGIAVPIFNQIAVNATDATGAKTVGLTFPSNITAGTYQFSIFGTYMGQYNPDRDPMHSKGSTSGTLTILEHITTSRRIRGNFNFRGEELATPANFTNISEGYFSVKY
jgi:hypothetical protein